MRLNYIISILLLTYSSLLFSQDDDVRFEVNVSKNKMGINERLKVDFSTNKDGDHFKQPSFKDFDKIAGPNLSVSSSWINGKSEYLKSYTFFLIPKRKGILKIESAKIEIDDKIYQTKPISIEVTNSPKQNHTTPNNLYNETNSDVFIGIKISNSNPYLNESIALEYRLYWRGKINITNLDRNIPSPKLNNFWSQNIDIKQLNIEQEILNGVRHNYVTFKKLVLYPQKTGKLTIKPITTDVTVSIPSGRIGFFGDMITKEIPRKIASRAYSIHVKELPKVGKPSNFSGAVGNFTLDVQINKSQLNTLESLQAKIKVNGRGNLNLFKLPTLSLPKSLEVYDPEFSEKLILSSFGNSGYIQNTYTIVPQRPGRYPFPTIGFSFFNPKTEKYVTLKSDPLHIEVKGNANDINNNTPLSLKREVESPKNQFKFLKTKTPLYQKKNTAFFNTASYYALLLTPILLIPILLLLSKRNKNITDKTQSIKSHKLAKKHLSNAKKSMDDPLSFYKAIHQAISNLLKAKLKFEINDLNKDKIQYELSEKGVKQETIHSLIDLLSECERAQYTPFSESDVKASYKNTLEIISNIVKQIK